MEKSKHVPCGETRKRACVVKLVTKETQKGASCFHVNKTWVGCTIVVVCICSILANVVLLVVYAGLQREVERQKVVLDRFSAFVSRNEPSRSDPRTPIPDSQTDLLKRNSHDSGHGHRGHRRKQGRGRRHVNHRILSRPVTQLSGTGGDNTDDIQSVDGYLLWKRPRPGTFSNSFSYEYNSGKVKSIKVKKPGIYYLYSKVGFHGKTIMNTAISECGHEVVRVRNDQVPHQADIKLLLKDVMTQDRQGRSYPNRAVDGSQMYPLDTQAQGGVFHLQLHDKLRVRISEYCRPYTRVNMDEDFTHFGAILINEI